MKNDVAGTLTAHLDTVLRIVKIGRWTVTIELPDGSRVKLRADERLELHLDLDATVGR